MKTLTTQKRAAILRCLIEGNSVRATCRITGAAKNTVIDLLEKTGEACTVFMDREMRDLPCKVLQLDEVWSFVGCREKNKGKAVNTHPGDIWTWTAICSETKLIPSWRVGDRSARTAADFCNDLADRFSGELQITSDGHPAYRAAVGNAFDIDKTHFAQLVKIYGQDEAGKEIVVRCDKVRVFGQPQMDLVSTSYVERSNLTLRMSNRRFTRLTNGFSKKTANHCHMLAVGFMHYNYCRKHMTLRSTPAQAGGLTDRQWTLEDVVEMIDGYFADKLNAEFEAAFVAKYTSQRIAPKSYPPQTPKLPWYLDFDGPGEPKL